MTTSSNPAPPPELPIRTLGATGSAPWTRPDSPEVWESGAENSNGLATPDTVAGSPDVSQRPLFSALGTRRAR